IIGLSLFFVLSCELSNSSQNEYTGQVVEMSKPLEKISIDNNSEVCIYSNDDEDLTLTIKSKSEETINNLLALSPVEIYEKYKGENAPEELVNLVKKTGFEPVPKNFDITTASHSTSKSNFYDMVDKFYDYWGQGTTLDESWAYYTKDSTYKKEVGGKKYLLALVDVCSGSVQHKMRRRVIRAFKKNYWTTISGPETLYQGEILLIRATYSKSREITSDVFDVNGVYNHIGGYKTYYYFYD
ncbi:MAG: hypothetical protein JXJ04_26315, partial [Spirochaetales bacterium]|nr:hypothetical protein [Spirochaetales bacterium]